MAEITGSKAALPAFKEGDGAGIKKLEIVSNKLLILSSIYRVIFEGLSN